MPASTSTRRRDRALRRTLDTKARIAKTAMKKMPQAIITSSSEKAFSERLVSLIALLHLRLQFITIGLDGGQARRDLQKDPLELPSVGKKDQPHLVARAVRVKAHPGLMHINVLPRDVADAVDLEGGDGYAVGDL